MNRATMHSRKHFSQMQYKLVENSKLKMIIVEDDAFLQSSIQFTLNKLGEIEVVGAFLNGSDVLNKANELQADIALIDV